MERIDKFTQKIDGFQGEMIPDWDFPGGSAEAFFDDYDKFVKNKEQNNSAIENHKNKKEESEKIEKSNKYEKWL